MRLPWTASVDASSFVAADGLPWRRPICQGDLPMSSILLRPVPPRPEGDIGGDATRSTHPVPPARRCPVEVTLEVIGDRWKALVVWHLFWGARPFCELMRQTRGISKKNLRRVLVEMEGLGLVWKVVR